MNSERDKMAVWKKTKGFLKSDRAVAAVEAGFLFPILMLFLCGMIDIGTAMTVNMKVTTAAQTISDLLARETTVDNARIQDAIVAGRLSLAPYDTATFGVDIAGIQYDGTQLTPVVRWRETRNMQPNQQITQRSRGLGDRNEGVIAVTVNFTFVPMFYKVIKENMVMSEEAFVRGRKGNFIQRL